MKFSRDYQYEDKGLIVLNGEGEFDSDSHPDFYMHLAEVEQRDPSVIGYDFSRISFLNSHSISALLRMERSLKGKGIQTYILAHPSPFVRTLINNLGLQDILATKSLDDILKDLEMQS